MRPGPVLLLGLLAAAWAYAPGLHAPPVHDDAVLASLPDLSGMGARFLRPLPPCPPGSLEPSYAYRPLAELSFALNRRAKGGYRILNLGIHLAAAALVFAVAARLLGSGDGAAWAALAFAVHPVGVQAVTYLYQRFTSLEALLALLSLWAYLKRRDGGGRAWGAASLGAGLLAAGAKETAATLPLVLGAVEWVLRDPAEPRAAVLRRWAPSCLVPAFLALQLARAGPVPEGPRESLFRPSAVGVSASEHLLLEAPVVAGYALKALWPFPLGFYQDRVLPPGPSIPWAATAASGTLLLAALVWIALGPARHRALRLAAALFLAPLALESTVFPIRDLAFLHRCYPGLLGAGLLLAWAGLRRPALAWAALACLALLARAENRIWADPDALLRRDVRHAWRRPEIWGGRADSLMADGHPRAAERLYRRASASPWKDAGVRAGWIRALAACGRIPEARRLAAEALERLPGDPRIRAAAAGLSAVR